ncbi:MAG: hypothetical protein ABIA74_00895 [bacterium]
MVFRFSICNVTFGMVAMMFLLNNIFYKFIFLFFIFCVQPLNAFRLSNLFKDYRLKKAYEKEDYYSIKDILQKDQIDNPNDAKLNYNLGTIFYKLNQFQDAQNSFIRAADNSNENLILKEKSYFNAGNSFYKGSLSLLGDNWEEEDLQEEILQLAMKTIENGVENYKNVLVLDDKNEEARKNKKLAEELLEKIKKKLPEKEKQQKQNQDKQNQNKDDKQEKQDKQNNEKEDAYKKEKGEKDENGDKKGRQSDQDKDDGQQEKNLEEQKQDEQEKDDQKTDDEKGDENQENKENQNENPEDLQEEKGPSASEQESDLNQEDGQEKDVMGLAQETDQNNNMKEKGMLAMLQDLQADESKMQKMLMKNKTENRGPLSKGQKPW